jgi:hypothetical protein
MLPPFYLPKEIVEITAFQQSKGVDRRCQNMAELIGVDFFHTGIQKLIPLCDRNLGSCGECVEKQLKYVHIFLV